MIHLPHRSVTRFFIPLIDVMTLLFCIFLLMPIVEGGPSGDRAAPGTPPTAALSEQERKELEELRGKVERLEAAGGLSARERRELERIRREKIQELQKRLAIRVLEIDENNGKLYYYDPDRVEITSEADAHDLIRRERQRAGNREVFFLFLYPRRITGFPAKEQDQQYDRWFEGVAHGKDNPRAGR